MDVNTLQNVLKMLFISLGGNADEVRDTNDISEIIRAISRLKLGESIDQKELPAVTSEDAGKVLTVSASGTWEAAELPADTEQEQAPEGEQSGTENNTGD